MKILLFNPYCTFDHSAYVFYRASIPYALMYIAAYLKKHSILPKIYELGIFNEKDVIRDGEYIRCGISDWEIKKILIREQPDIVGISTMYTVFHKDYVEIIKMIKDYDPKIHVVVGGNHASSFPEMMLEAGADQVVVGEGEQAFLDICNGAREPIVHRELIKDLDTIPFPATESIDFERHISVNNPFVMRTPVTGIITSRGCPNNCIYCTANGVWQHKWRGRSPKNIVDEIEWMIKLHGIKEFHFLDDNIAVDKNRLFEICDEIIKRKIDIRWANCIPYWVLDEPLLRLMKKSGCYRLTFGIESGDLEVRKYIGKNYTLQKAKDVIRYANSIGLWTITNNIVGFPEETEAQIRRTIEFAKECGTDFACFFALLPHPSARVYKDFLKWGLIDPKDQMSALNEGGAPTRYFSKEQIKDFQKQAYSEFITFKMWEYIKKPWLLLGKIRSVEDLRYLIRIGWLGLRMKLRQNKKVSSSKDFIYGKEQYVKK